MINANVQEVCMGKVTLFFLASLLYISTVLGAGFHIGEFGGRSAAMGNAVIAQAYDPSVIFYNPAGLGFLEGTQFYGGVTGILAKANFVGAAPVFDNTVHNAKEKFFPPVGIYATHRFSEKIAAGVGLTNPFGLGLEWEDNFPGRFISKNVDLKSFYISPVIAYQISPNVSIAAGVDVVLTSVLLNRNILIFNTEGVPGTGTEVGEVELSGNGDPTLGFSAGFMYRNDRVGFGVSYRHSVTAEFTDADADFTVFDSADPNAKAVASALFTDQKGSAAIDFPSILSVGLYYKLTPQLGMEVSYVYYNWSVFEKIDLKFEDERLNQTIPENYENSSQVRIGAHYDVNERLSLRAGYLWDETPQPIESVSPL
ncbi:MAG: hypothetical protein D6732_18875, partial [Methanobacteriota archaeon]